MCVCVLDRQRFSPMPGNTFFGRTQGCCQTPLRNTMYGAVDAAKPVPWDETTHMHIRTGAYTHTLLRWLAEKELCHSAAVTSLRKLWCLSSRCRWLMFPYSQQDTAFALLAAVMLTAQLLHCINALESLKLWHFPQPMRCSLSWSWFSSVKPGG